MQISDVGSGGWFKSMKSLMLLAMIVLGVALPKVTLAQGETSPKETQLPPPRTQELNERRTQKELTKLGADPSWVLLTRKASELGFTAKENGGIVETAAQAGREEIPATRLAVFPYFREKSPDLAALISVTHGNRKYYAFDIAANGDFQNVTEWTVRDREVMEAHSWWHCVVSKLGPDCGAPCVAALASCPKTDWKAYLLCLAERCGPCFGQVVGGCFGQ
jgi:hypothetical protein